MMYAIVQPNSSKLEARNTSTDVPIAVPNYIDTYTHSYLCSATESVNTYLIFMAGKKLRLKKS